MSFASLERLLPRCTEEENIEGTRDIDEMKKRDRWDDERRQNSDGNQKR